MTSQQPLLFKRSKVIGTLGHLIVSSTAVLTLLVGNGIPCKIFLLSKLNQKLCKLPNSWGQMNVTFNTITTRSQLSQIVCWYSTDHPMTTTLSMHAFRCVRYSGHSKAMLTLQTVQTHWIMYSNWVHKEAVWGTWWRHWHNLAIDKKMVHKPESLVTGCKSIQTVHWVQVVYWNLIMSLMWRKLQETESPFW